MKALLDPRSKILLIGLAAIYMGLLMPWPMEILVIGLFLLPLWFAGLYKQALTFIGVFIIQLLTAVYFLPNIHSLFFLYIVSFLANGLRSFLPGIIAGTYAFKTTTVNQWIAAFKKWRLPNFITIPLAVMARFFPTVKEDYYHIRQAMALRGIGTSLSDLIKKPIQSLEYIYIPLLMNATKVTEDLTVSALTKGLSLPNAFTSIEQLHFKAFDWFYLILASLPLIFYWGGAFEWVR